MYCNSPYSSHRDMGTIHDLISTHFEKNGPGTSGELTGENANR